MDAILLTVASHSFTDNTWSEAVRHAEAASFRHQVPHLGCVAHDKMHDVTRWLSPSPRPVSSSWSRDQACFLFHATAAELQDLPFQSLVALPAGARMSPAFLSTRGDFEVSFVARSEAMSSPQGTEIRVHLQPEADGHKLAKHQIHLTAFAGAHKDAVASSLPHLHQDDAVLRSIRSSHRWVEPEAGEGEGQEVLAGCNFGTPRSRITTKPHRSSLASRGEEEASSSTVVLTDIQEKHAEGKSHSQCLMELAFALASQPFVSFVEPRLEVKRRNYYIQTISQVTVPCTFPLASALTHLPPSTPCQSGQMKTHDTPFWDRGINGSGEVVGVADTGLDDSSCFFRDNVLGNVTRTAKDSTDYIIDHQQRKVISYVAYVDGKDEKGGHGQLAAS